MRKTSLSIFQEFWPAREKIEGQKSHCLIGGACQTPRPMGYNPADVKSIFLDAIENYTPDQWAAYLDGVCGHDVHLRLRVEELLKAHAELGSPRGAAFSSSQGAAQDETIAERPGQIIGRYKLLEEIGEGCLLYTSPSPRDRTRSRMPSSA